MTDRLDEIFERLGKMSSDIENSHDLTQKNYTRTGELFDRTDQLQTTIRDMQIAEHPEQHEFVGDLRARIQARTVFWQNLQTKVMEKGILAMIWFAVAAFGIGAWQIFKDRL